MPTLPIAIVTAFARNERGGVAILFGVCAMVLTVTIGVAIDHARVHHSTSKLAAAADAAALAAGRALMDGGDEDDEIAEIGERFFNQNLSGGRQVRGRRQASRSFPIAPTARSKSRWMPTCR